MEKYFKMRSRFLGEKMQFFRQIKANLPISSIYYIKPPWQNANSKFSRKFAPEVSTAFNRGGFNLNKNFEKPADTWRYQKLFQCKVGLFLERYISTHSWYFKRIILCDFIIDFYRVTQIKIWYFKWLCVCKEAFLTQCW